MRAPFRESLHDAVSNVDFYVGVPMYGTLWFTDRWPSNPPGKLQTCLFGEHALNYSYGFCGIPGYLGGKPMEDADLTKKKLPRAQDAVDHVS